MHSFKIDFVTISESYLLQILIGNDALRKPDNHQNAECNHENAAENPEPPEKKSATFQEKAVQEIVQALVHYH